MAIVQAGFDFGVGMWYSEEKEGSALGRLHNVKAKCRHKVFEDLWRLSSYSLSLKYERAAITVPATVATHVTNPTTNSAVIRKPPSI